MVVGFPLSFDTVPVTLTTILVGVAKCDPHDPLFSPLHLTDYSKLGPIFYQVASMDIWKDSALFYCDKVEKAGGKVKLELLSRRTPHMVVNVPSTLDQQEMGSEPGKWSRMALEAE